MSSTPGGSLVGIGATVGTWIASAMMACTVLVLGFGVVFVDLSLGPQFMGAYAEQHGSPSLWMTQAIPWSFSIATTGFQFMLYRGYSEGKNFRSAGTGGKIAFAAGWIVAALDTTTDVAGFTSFMYGAEQGVNVMPDQPTYVWYALAGVVALLCGFQEVLLVPLLHSSATGLRSHGIGGAILVEGAVTLVGWFFNIVRTVALAFAIAAILALDFMLTFYWLDVQLETAGLASGWSFWASVFLSGAATGAQVMLFRRKTMGGVGWKSSMVYITWALALADTASDIGGFTTLMYGPEQGLYIVPDNPPIAWCLIAATIFGLCQFYEYMLATMLSSEEQGGGADDGEG